MERIHAKRQRLAVLTAAILFAVPMSAQAIAEEVYTKRRINGVWVSGEFPRAAVDAELRRLRPARPMRSRQVSRRPKPSRRDAVQVSAPTRAPANVGLQASALNTDEANYERVRDALTKWAAQTLAQQQPVSAPSRPIAKDVSIEVELAPVKETYDYVTGVKTTVLTGGVVLEEPIVKTNPSPAQESPKS